MDNIIREKIFLLLSVGRYYITVYDSLSQTIQNYFEARAIRNLFFGLSIGARDNIIYSLDRMKYQLVLFKSRKQEYFKAVLFKRGTNSIVLLPGGHGFWSAFDVPAV